MLFPLPCALWLALPAEAVDLDVLVTAWTIQKDGGVGATDAALGTAIGSGGEVVVAGYLTQTDENGTDGYAVAYRPDGQVLWEIIEDVGPVGPDRTSSEDRLHAVSIDALIDQVVLCGARGMSVSTDPTTRFLVEAWEPDFLGGYPSLRWDEAYIDGNPATSPNQACLGAHWTDGHVFATGYGDHADDVGRWISWKFEEASGTIAFTPLFYEYSSYEAVPDQAHDISANSGTDEIVVVGTRGIAGLAGSLLNDTDWYVRQYDGTGLLLWEDTLAGANQLDDQALAVVADVATGDVFVAGHQNNGTDNGDGADFDWVVIRYDGDGDGLGGPSRIWTHTWSSAPGASEGATAITLDEFGDVLVGGYAIDPATGLEQWRIAKLDADYGSVVQEWLGPVGAGDARLLALEYRSGVIAMAGTISDGTQLDFAVSKLEGDQDEDGFGDSVDACPADPDKGQDSGICGCNVPDVDTDGDGFENCLEECATNPDKQEPGVCGCEEPDIDTDGDLTFDCEDRCPDDPNKADSVGVCGCGNPDADTDGDGVLGCDDACSNTPPNTPVDQFGCPLEESETGETGDTGDTLPVTDDTKGCGCQSSAPRPSSASWLASLGLMGVLYLRRRGRPAIRLS